MRVRFLGTTSSLGQSPTLFATDRGTLVVQGYVISDPEALADIGDVPAGETVVEIPAALLTFHERPMAHDPRTGERPASEDGAREER